ncbi:MAG: ester cyclase [Candidatus Contendobacter sp.]|nr:ester cyclase [Candidatus Contendobacter sp.]
MPLTPQQMDQKIDEHFVYEHHDDIEGVLATLAPDATHDVVGWPNGPSHGREAARDFYKTLFADLSGEQVTPLRRLYGDGFLVDESRWRGQAPGRPFGLEGRGRPLDFRLLHVVEFTETGQIQKEQVWIDLAAILQQLPQEP